MYNYLPYNVKLNNFSSGTISFCPLLGLGRRDMSLIF